MSLIEGAAPGICVRCGRRGRYGVKCWVKTSQLCDKCYPIAQQEWETPPDLWEAIEARFGKIKTDVCASEENTKCGLSYFDKYHDALRSPWIRPDCFLSAYCNPGFKKPLPWAEKAYSEAQRHEDALVLQLGLTNHSAKWWGYAHDMAIKALLLRPRPQFIAAPGIEQTSNPREITLFEYRHDSRMGTERNDIQVWDWKATS